MYIYGMCNQKIFCEQIHIFVYRLTHCISQSLFIYWWGEISGCSFYLLFQTYFANPFQYPKAYQVSPLKKRSSEIFCYSTKFVSSSLAFIHSTLPQLLIASHRLYIAYHHKKANTFESFFSVKHATQIFNLTMRF